MADQRSILSVIPVQDFKFTRTDQTSHENVYLFQGSENTLKLSKTHDTKFLCQYDMAWYPFDSQICTMDIVLNIVQVESSWSYKKFECKNGMNEENLNAGTFL